MFCRLLAFLLISQFAFTYGQEGSAIAMSIPGVIKTCTVPKTFALTFDDGPYTWNSVLAKLLKDANSTGTFFINGNNWNCIYNGDLAAQLKRTFDQGHLIASHTWSHPDITKITDAQLHKQLDLIEMAMIAITGHKPRYFRPPYGYINKRNVDLLHKRGYQIISWDVDSGDALGVPVDHIKARYNQWAATSPTPHISLNHETHETTATQTTPHAIRVLRRAGYKLVSVAECLGLGTKRSDWYTYVGPPKKRDASWTCNGTPAPGQV
ncbi:family 4 carbohydrate esterase [Melampsora americana]|nr:family 4 carbohydrate esterase [Melampsora americana]